MPSEDSPPGPSKQQEIEHAALSAVAYRNAFSFPLTLEEIHRFLPSVSCGIADVRHMIDATEMCHGRLVSDGTYFALKGRESLLSVRHEREVRARTQLKTALGIARLLSTIPNVRMIALTGSLAARNAYEDADIDLLVVANAGRMWRTRAAVLVVAALDRMTLRRGICPNLHLSTAALEMPEQRMYVAIELAQMVPLFGADVYRDMRAVNAWTQDYLPNALHAPVHLDCAPVRAVAPIKTPLEWVANSWLGTRIEGFERRRKIARFNDPSYYGKRHTRFTEERTGHRAFVGDLIEEDWKNCLAAVLNGETLRDEDYGPHRDFETEADPMPPGSAARKAEIETALP